jgi:hypothetical protein
MSRSCGLANRLSLLAVVESLGCLGWLRYLAFDVVQNHLSNVLKR